MQRLAFVSLFLLTSGCAWVGPQSEADFFDQDGDGVAWPEDCDDNDFQVQSCDTSDTDVTYDGARRRVDRGWRAPVFQPRGG